MKGFLLMQSPNWYILFFLIFYLLAKQENLVEKAHTLESEESSSNPGSATTCWGRLSGLMALISSPPQYVPTALWPSGPSHFDSGLSNVTSFANAAVANWKQTLEKRVSTFLFPLLSLCHHWENMLRFPWEERPCGTELSYLNQVSTDVREPSQDQQSHSATFKLMSSNKPLLWEDGEWDFVMQPLLTDILFI